MENLPLELLDMVAMRLAARDYFSLRRACSNCSRISQTPALLFKGYKKSMQFAPKMAQIIRLNLIHTAQVGIVELSYMASVYGCWRELVRTLNSQVVATKLADEDVLLIIQTMMMNGPKDAIESVIEYWVIQVWGSLNSIISNPEIVNQILLKVALANFCKLTEILLQDDRIDIEKYGAALLQSACRLNYEEIVKILLRNKKIDATESNFLALRLAQQIEGYEIERMILDRVHEQI